MSFHVVIGINFAFFVVLIEEVAKITIKFSVHFGKINLTNFFFNYNLKDTVQTWILFVKADRTCITFLDIFIKVLKGENKGTYFSMSTRVTNKSMQLVTVRQVKNIS